MKLRYYQRDAHNAAWKAWRDGQKKILEVLPTGTGKTIIFSAITQTAMKLGERVLILAHREELLDQAADKLYMLTGLSAEIEKAEKTATGKARIVIGSIQSMSQEKRLEKFPNDYFSLLIIDEAHHAVSTSYKRVLEHFNAANVIGVTATPDRGDLKDLGTVFDGLAYEYETTQAIRDGFLCPVRAQMIPLKLDISQVSVSNGDFSVGETGTALEPYLGQIADEMATYCVGRRTVVFLPLIATAKKFCQLLKERGFKAAEVDGKSRDRKQILSDFEAGKFDVLCNAMLLTEGWDCPQVDCIVVLRPTKMSGLYRQIVGRGMRPASGKKNLLLLDFLWLTAKHGLCHPATILGKDEIVQEELTKLVEDNPDGVDLLGALGTAEKNAIETREKSLAEELEKSKARKRELVDPLQFCFSIEAEDLACYEPAFSWETTPPTEIQIKTLEKHGIYAAEIPTAGYAEALLEKLSAREGLASPKQIRCLEKMGFMHVGKWKKADAQKLIRRLAACKWVIPHGINPRTYKP